MMTASSHDIFHDTFADDFLEFSSFGWLDDDMLVEMGVPRMAVLCIALKVIKGGGYVSVSLLVMHKVAPVARKNEL